jgi:hypothetical protein
MMRSQFLILPRLMATLLVTAYLFATDERAISQEAKQGWGNLSATFVYDGEPPKPRELKVDKDTGFVKVPLYDQSLQVDAKTKGIANVAIWLYVARGEASPPIHASYAELAKQDVVMETRNAQIEPHVVLLWLPQTLVTKNTDAIGHNTKGDFFANPAWSDLWAAGMTTKRKMSKQESRPMPLACNIHPWESGWMLIRANPYMAVSNTQGKLQIKNLPAGTHTFVLWHELAGYIKEAKRDGKEQVIDKGRLTVDIKPGDNDLGEFVIKPAPRTPAGR